MSSLAPHPQDHVPALELIQGGLDESKEKEAHLEMTLRELSALTEEIEAELKEGWCKIRLQRFEALLEILEGLAPEQAEVMARKLPEWRKKILRHRIRSMFAHVLNHHSHVTLGDIAEAKRLVEEGVVLDVEHAQAYQDKFFLLDEVARKITSPPPQDFSSVAFNLGK